MGQGTARLVRTSSAAARVRALGDETEQVRREMDDLMTELDRRRHEALDWKLQARRHARGLALALGGLIGAIGVAVALSMARRRRQATLSARVADIADRGERLRRALGRIIEEPDRLAPEEPRRGRLSVGVPAAASAALATARVLLPHVRGALARWRASRPASSRV